MKGFSIITIDDLFRENNNSSAYYSYLQDKSLVDRVHKYRLKIKEVGLRETSKYYNKYNRRNKNVR